MSTISLYGGDTAEGVFEKDKKIIDNLLEDDFALKRHKVKGAAREIQFLGVLWQDGCHHLPLDMVNKIATMVQPINKKETQAFLGVEIIGECTFPDIVK